MKRLFLSLMALTVTVLLMADTPREQLIRRLHNIHAKGVMMGMQDAPVYGTTWKWDEGRCDMKEVCGDYPAVMGFDLGKIELDSEKNLDGVPFERIRKEVRLQHERGGIITISWHPWNPVTGENAWDPSGNAVVESLPGGSVNQKFHSWVVKVADFLKSLKTNEGQLVPVIFRPWHEMSGGWFWWGCKSCTPEQYRQFFRYTVDILKTEGVDNCVWSYSPGADRDETIERYMQYYPGDEYVDMLGVDIYRYGTHDSFMNNIRLECEIMRKEANNRNKLYAITETGYRNTPQNDWFTAAILPVMLEFDISYVLLWRNAWDQAEENFSPAPEKGCADDFRKLYAHKRTLFAKDVKVIK